MEPEEYVESILASLREAGLYREPDSKRRAEAEAAAASLGLPLIEASSNDYLGLGHQPVSRETFDALSSSQSGAGASRLVHGTQNEHLELEETLAHWVQKPSSLFFSSGFAANLGVLQALGGPQTLFVSDALNHASIVDGCRLNRSQIRVVPHLSLEATEKALAEGPTFASRWVVTESYFSMDGDGPNLQALSKLCQRFGAGLIVDEAHALGVFGPTGSGRCAEAGVQPDVIVGTFGKALGLHGAFVAGSKALRALLWNRARSQVFSTAPSPILAKLVTLHVKRVQSASAEREALLRTAATLRADLGDLNLIPAQSFGPIVPVLCGSNERALEAAAALAGRGILTQAIRPPTVPAGTARLRITLSAGMGEVTVQRLGRELRAVLSRATLPAVSGSAKPLEPRTGTRRVVVLGTGTGVGKTWFTEALAISLRRAASRPGTSTEGYAGAVLALKPVETGVLGGTGDDAARIALAAGHVAPDGAWVFSEPVSPHLAAREHGTTLGTKSIADWVRAQTAQCPTLQYVLVETAGGAFSPLAPGVTNFDLALELEPATWILVAPDSLGVLHDVTVTLGAMKRRGRVPDHVVLCAAREADASTGLNARELSELGITSTSACLGRGECDLADLVSSLIRP